MTKSNWEWLKSETREAVDKQVAELNPPYEYAGHAPMLHQKAMFLLCTMLPYYLMFLDTGTGKTKIVLDLIKWCKDAKQTKAAIIFVPNRENVYGWIAEAKIHAPSLKFMGLTDDMTHSRKVDILKAARYDALVMTYAGFVSLVTLPKNKRPERRYPKRAQASDIDFAKFEEYTANIDFMVCDESTFIKNSASLSFVCLSLLAEQCNRRYALAARPFGRNAEDLWSQFYCIDKGISLGKTITEFRKRYFECQQNYFGRMEWKLKPSMKPALSLAAQNRSIFWSSDECLDLPELRKITKEVPLSDDARAVYDDLKNKTETASQLKNSFVKFRTLASGFSYNKEEDFLAGNVDAYPPYKKIEALAAVVDEIPEDRKAVISYEFIHSGDSIAAMLKEKKIKFVRVGKTKDAVGTFTKNDKYRVLLMANQAGSYGLNIQAANYLLIYESPVSPIVRHQLERRIYRPGQTRKSFIYDFVSRETVEKTVLDYVREGKSLFESISGVKPADVL